MKIAIVVGTRPEVIKMSPLIRKCQEWGVSFSLIHSNQHYSENMDRIFFEELRLPAPDYNLQVGSGGHSNQIGNILIKIEPVLHEVKPDIVLVQGDTNTVVAAALAAHKSGIKVAHIEAGLRSFDRTMPEESNRVMTDHLSDYLFAVTNVQSEILQSEGINRSKIKVVGNTIVDAVLCNKEIAIKRSDILKKLGLHSKKYCLFTAHRASNVDSKQSLEEVISLLKLIPEQVCWPIHVRTQKKLNEFHLKLPSNVITTEPLGFMDFLNLEQNAKLIVTDSGGLQEEACILGIPCITIRDNTERPETVQVGANVLVGRDPEKFQSALKRELKTWKNPFGQGNSSEVILETIFGRRPVAKKKVTVVGLGYMGLPTSLLMAREGHEVCGFDIDQAKVDRINKGLSPFDEKGLPELLKEAIQSGNFKAESKIRPAEIYVIAVPTPHHDKKCDLTYVLKAAESVSTVAKNGDVVIIESTIKPNTCRDHVAPIFTNKNLRVHVVHCPERAIPGDTLHELLHNDRIIGAMDERGAKITKELYSSFVKGEIFLTDATTAEVAKLMENTYRDVNIALANEFSMLADDLKFNVWEAIRLANRHPRVNILSPGPGVGGHCIAIDPWFLTEDFDKAKVIVASREVNDRMPAIVVERLNKIFPLKKGSKVGILGVAYKKNVDDARETPAEHIYKILSDKGCLVTAHDPFVEKWDHPIERDLERTLEWADTFILVTDHDEYRKLQLEKPFIDTRNILR